MNDEELSEEGRKAAYWHSQLEKAKKTHSKWHKRGKKIIERYRDERESDVLKNSNRRLNMLWSNVETLKPSLYSNTPKPETVRRFKDDDAVAREASQVLDRALEYTLDRYDFDSVLSLNVSDYLLVARGQAWAKYSYSGDEEITDEMALCEYVHWQDFLHNKARHWGEVTWVAKRAYLTKREGVDRFGDEFKKVSLNYHEDKEQNQEVDTDKKAIVWEIWDKATKKVYFIAEGHKDRPLEVSDPFIDFKGFFPCPRPLLGTTATDSVIPTPDYALYQDQAEELDDITGRIALLVQALKVAGVYDSSSGSLERLLQDGGDNILIPVENWAMLAGKGGLNGVIDFIPLDMVAKALIHLYEARDRTKADLYEVTGLSDIIRGASNPNETATAQGIKAQWGSIRIRDRQKEVQRYARDIIRLLSEIICEQFSQETLMKMTGVKLPSAEQVAMEEMQHQQEQMQKAQQAQMQQQPFEPQLYEKPVTWEDVMSLLQDDVMRSFKIDIETDSTILADEQEEKQQRTEFVTAITQFFASIMPIVQAAPETIPMFGDILLFTVRAFDSGEQLEESIETAVENLKQKAAQPQPNPQAEMQKKEMEVKGKELELKGQEIQLKGQEIQQDGQLAQQENQLKVMELQDRKAERGFTQNPY